MVQPIGFALDDRGRLWVAENLSYPHWEPRGRDRILILEDADGDGRFDRRSVFAEGLTYVTGIEVGFGGVWVMAPPEMLFIPDRDGDDRPDGPPQVLLDGFGTEGIHNIANGFTWGPDGWLYAGHGRTSISRLGRPGTPPERRVRFDGGVWRYHPTRHVFEPFCDGTTNPWGVAFDDYGQAFISNCVDPHLFHAVQGAHFEPWRGRESSRHAYRRIDTIADHVHWKSGEAGYRDASGGHAHCGVMVYLGDLFPPPWRGAVFMNSIHGRRVNMDLLRRAGSGFRASHGPDLLVSRDPHYMGLLLQYGPDGGVYVNDWYDIGECHTRRPQVWTGRIYKILYGEPRRVRADVGAMSDAELVHLQLHPNDWFVAHARRRLQERAAAGPDPAVHAGLREILGGNPDPTRKLRALWALHVTGVWTPACGRRFSGTPRSTCAPGRSSSRWRTARRPRRWGGSSWRWRGGIPRRWCVFILRPPAAGWRPVRRAGRSWRPWRSGRRTRGIRTCRSWCGTRRSPWRSRTRRGRRRSFRARGCPIFGSSWPGGSLRAPRAANAFPPPRDRASSSETRAGPPFPPP